MSRIPISDDTELDDPWELDLDEPDIGYSPLDFDFVPSRIDLDIVDTFDSDFTRALDEPLEVEIEVPEEIDDDSESPTPEELSLISEILHAVDELQTRH